MIKSRLPEFASSISKDKNNILKLESLILQNAKTIKKGDIVSGEIVKINNDYIYVDVKAKTHGILSVKEFQYEDEMPNIGQIIDVYIKEIQIKNDSQIPILSRELAIRNALWDQLQDAYKESKTILGKIVEYNVSNKTFDIYASGIIMKLQANHMDITNIQNAKNLIGKSEEFLILKIIDTEDIGSKIFLSRKQICLNNLHAENQLGINEHKIFQGKVIKVCENGLEVLFSLANKQTIKGWLAYNINTNQDLKVGDICEVSVLKVENAKVHLTQDYACLESIKKYLVSDVVTEGKIVKITDFGIFVYLPDKTGAINRNIQGLIHLSETCGIRGKTLKTVFKPNQIIEIRTKSTYQPNENNKDNKDAKDNKKNKDNKKIALTIRDTKTDPWRNLKIKVGDQFKLTVRDMFHNRIFVGISDMLDGLIRYNQHTAWKIPKINDEIETTVIEINPSENKLILIEGYYDIDQVKSTIIEAEKNKNISGKIIYINKEEKSIIVSTQINNINFVGFILEKNLEKEFVKYNIGDKIQATVKNFDWNYFQFCLTMQNIDSQTNLNKKHKVNNTLGNVFNN